MAHYLRLDYGIYQDHNIVEEGRIKAKDGEASCEKEKGG